MSYSAVAPVNQSLALTSVQQIGEASFGIFDRIKLIALTLLQQIGKALSYLFSTLKNIVEPLPPAVKGVAMAGGGIALVVLFICKYFSKQKLKKVEPQDNKGILWAEIAKDILWAEIAKELIVSVESLSRELKTLQTTFSLKEAGFQEFLKKNKVTEQQFKERVCHLEKNFPKFCDYFKEGAKDIVKISSLLAKSKQLLDGIERGEEVVKKTAEIRTLFTEVNRLFGGIVGSEEMKKVFAEARILSLTA